MRDDGPIVREITTAVYVIPTDTPEADGTLTWDKTTMVLASARAGTARGIGFAAYALWRLSEVAFGVTGEKDGAGPRLISLGRAVVYAGFA